MSMKRYTPFTGTETAGHYEVVYPFAGPKLGPLLLDSNVVLTIAGARGSTNLYTHYTDHVVWQQALLLDQYLRAQGIALTPYKIPPNAPTQEQTIMLLIENLRGYAYVSQRIRIPGVSPFTAGSVTEWMRQISQGLTRAHQQGQFAFPVMYLEQLYDGLLEVYPDQALKDEIDWRRKGQKTALANAAIPYRRYSGCRHTFAFYPEHAHDPSIVQTIALWSTILTQFYTSPWFASVKGTNTFQYTREASRVADERTRETLWREHTTAVAA